MTITKAERIRQLLADKEIRLERKAMQERIIANLVGCRPEYVRTVKQRLSPAKRAKDCARTRAMGRTADQALIKRASRIAYREARKAGMSWPEALKLANKARARAINATGDLAAARQAYHSAKRGTSHA